MTFLFFSLDVEPPILLWYITFMNKMSKFTIEIDREIDGRWIADVQELPGVLSYGKTRREAAAKAEALALRVIADQLEVGGSAVQLSSIDFAFA